MRNVPPSAREFGKQLQYISLHSKAKTFHKRKNTVRGGGPGCTHVCLMSLPQVVCEVLLDVLDEVVGIFGVKVQHLVQPLQVDTLQVTVGQGFHVRIGFYHPVVQGHVRPDQVTFTCPERERETCIHMEVRSSIVA